MKKLFQFIAVALLGIVLTPYGCGGDDTGSGSTEGAGASRPDQTGAVCAVPADCYPEIDPTTLQGSVLCLDRVRDGYCTHTCESDADCCAVQGECKTDITQVCSPFESTGMMMCFLSCESADIVPAGTNEQAYCQEQAGRDFICRSSGGGGNNRKVCVPGDCGVGAACLATTDCAAGLECITGFLDGYCTQPSGCTTNAECPANSLCVRHLDGQNYCFRTCAGNTDCTFCRGYDDLTACDGLADFVEAGTTGTVCVPK